MTTAARTTIIYASARFVKRLKCTVSLSLDKPTQAQTTDGWSGDILKVSRAGGVAVMMHDASLATIVVPLKDIRRFEEFLSKFLRNVAELWELHGATFDAANQNVLVLRRNNRSLIGSLNNAKQLIEFTITDQMEAGQAIDWNEAQQLTNETPFTVIDSDSPFKRLASLLLPAG